VSQGAPVGGEAGGLGRWLSELVRAAQWHRRLLAAGLLAGSVALGLQALAPDPPATVAVVAATRDLPAGTRLGYADLTTVGLEPSVVPSGALRSQTVVRGRTLVSAVRKGEPLTDARLLAPSALDLLGPGLVAAPVRVTDAATVRLLRPGDVVDVLAAGGTEVVQPARLVAAAVRVVTVPRDARDAFGAGSGGGLVLLATSSSTAARLAGAAVAERLSLVLRHE
jgi:Flp pilus assembly protein CpaB